MIDPETLLSLRPAELRRLLETGHPIDPDALRDREYLGTSLGLPGWVERVTWKKFKKVFCGESEKGRLRGWNVRVRQNALDEPWIDQLDAAGHPVTFGHYRVVEPTPDDRCGSPRPGLLIDYGLGGNRRLDPVRALRDPIVALRPGSVELLLGWTYLSLAGRTLGTPSYFLLERGGPLEHVAAPPSA